jgi:hypothetical protein
MGVLYSPPWQNLGLSEINDAVLSLLIGADNECASRSPHHVLCDQRQFVDAKNPRDLNEEPLQEM